MTDKNPYLILVVAVVAGSALLGCASTEAQKAARKPLTQEEIIVMAQQQVPEHDIIRRIKASGTVYRLTASEITNLHKHGVSNGVIDFMLQDYIESVRWQEREYSRFDSWYAWGPHYYWHWPPHVVVIRNGRHRR